MLGWQSIPLSLKLHQLLPLHQTWLNSSIKRAHRYVQGKKHYYPSPISFNLFVIAFQLPFAFPTCGKKKDENKNSVFCLITFSLISLLATHSYMWPCCPFDAHYFLLLDSCLGCRDCHIPGVFTCVTKSNYRPDTWRPRTFCTENRVTLRLVGGFWGNISLNSGVLTCDLPVNVCITSARRHSAATQVPRLRQLVPHASNCFPLDAAAGELQHLPSRLPRRLILEDCSSCPTRAQCVNIGRCSPILALVYFSSNTHCFQS